MSVNSTKTQTARAIISTVLVIALIVGIFILVYCNNGFKEVKGKHHNRINENIVQLDKTATKYKITTWLGEVKISSTEKEPYIRTESVYDIQTDVVFANDVYVIDVAMNSLFDNNFMQSSMKNKGAPKIEIYLPKDMLDSVEIEMKAGELLTDEINTTTLSVDMLMGKATIKNCCVNNFTSEVKAGELNFYAQENIKAIESKVKAGDMNLYLPKGIDGFTCNYNIAAGGIQDVSSFDLDKLNDDFFALKQDSIVYGDGFTKINLDVSTGNLNFKDYIPKIVCSSSET